MKSLGRTDVNAFGVVFVDYGNNAVFAVHVSQSAAYQSRTAFNGYLGVANFIDSLSCVGKLLHRVAVDGSNRSAVNGNDHGALVAYGAVHDKTAARSVSAVAVVRRLFVNSVALNSAVIESGVAALDIYAGVTLKRTILKRYVMIGSKIRAEAGITRISGKLAVFDGNGRALKQTVGVERPFAHNIKVFKRYGQIFVALRNYAVHVFHIGADKSFAGLSLFRRRIHNRNI